MVIDINNAKVLWMPVTYYTIKGNNEEIEKITLDGRELDLTCDSDLVEAIDALVDSKKSSNLSNDEYKMASSVFGASFNFEEIAKKFNDITDNLIYKIEALRYKLRTSIQPTKCSDECCTCVDDKYCSACQEADKASKSVEAVANTRTFHWAQKYMEEVIDPNNELTGPEYNTLLAMFTQYGEWILQQ